MAILLGTVAFTVPASFANINLVSNGSFEGSVPTVPSPWVVFTTTNPGQSQPSSQPGVTTVLYNTTGQYSEFYKADNAIGGFSTDAAGLNGIYLLDDGVTSTITQTISVVGGHTYNVGFDLYNALTSVTNVNSSSVKLVVGGSSFGAIQSTPATAGNWSNYNYTYTAPANATSASFQISYEGGDYAGGYGQDFVLDKAYAVDAATPEPGFFAVLGLGFSGMILAVKRRRKA